MIDFNRSSEGLTRYLVELGFFKVQVRSSSSEEAIVEARRKLCVELPRLWDVIHATESNRFRVKAVS